MQESKLDFSLLKFKKRIKIRDKDLPTFFFVVLYNGYNASKFYFYYV